MKTSVVVGLVMVAALALAAGGCGKKSTEAPAPQGQPGPGSSYRMSLRIAPNPPKYNQDATFRVALTDLQGKPVEGANVLAHIVMPGMDMGENKVAFTDLGGGNYQGVGRFGMGGDFNVVVEAFKAGASGKVTFKVTAEL